MLAMQKPQVQTIVHTYLNFGFSSGFLAKKEKQKHNRDRREIEILDI